MSDRETLRYLAKNPWLRPDYLLKRTLVEFPRRYEEGLALTRRDDQSYNILAKDFKNNKETKATKELLNTKITDLS